MTPSLGRIACSVALMATVAACATSGGTGRAAPSAGTPSPSIPVAAASTRAIALTIDGASSLKGALTKVKVAYEAAVPGVILTIATDASSTLRTQIEQGAPVDIFLSADESNPKKLVDGGLADGGAIDYAGNLLTVVVPIANPASIATPADLARPGVKVIAAGVDVPITRYAMQSVTNLAGLPGYPAGFAAAYAANVVSHEDNVKAVVAKIELGEGDAAIVYVTDAKSSAKVLGIAIPDAANVPARYAGVVVKASTNALAAHALLSWLAGPDGQAVLAGFGFLPPS